MGTWNVIIYSFPELKIAYFQPITAQSILSEI